MTEPVNILPFGACLLNEPLAPILREGTRLTKSKYAPLPPCYTFGIMLQAIAMLRGERDVPSDIRPLCGINPRAGPVPGSATFADVDVALLEPASPIEIAFRGCSLNRIQLYKLVVEPIRAIDADAYKAASVWFLGGIEKLNADVRAETARKVLELLPGDFENRELTQAVLLETTAKKSDILGCLGEIRERLARPIGVVTYVFQYLADGRVVSWPAGFLEEVRDSAHRLGLPILEPAEHVLKYPRGVAAALKPDLRHYSDEFLPVMGERIVEFCQSIRNGARSFAAA